MAGVALGTAILIAVTALLGALGIALVKAAAWLCLRDHDAAQAPARDAAPLARQDCQKAA